MQFGVFTVGDVTTDPTTGITVTEEEAIKVMVAVALKAEEAGPDVFAAGEHHNPPFVPSSPTTMLGYIAARTERLQLSTATTLITTNDPVKIAEDFAMLQHLSGGRVDLGGLWLPGRPGLEVRIEADQQTSEVVAVTLVLGDSALQVQPFAAPRSEGIWDDVRAEIRAARATDPGLFAIFPRRPGAKPCSIPDGAGLTGSSIGGMCETSVAHPVTHGRYAEAFVTFRESWGRRHSSWTLIVQLPAEKVVATQLHGDTSPQTRYAATE